MRLWISIIVVIYTLLSSCSANSSDQKEWKFVSVSEGTNMAVAVSQDERFMILDLQGALYKKDLHKSQADPITGYYMDARQPDISSDGSEVCFQSYQDGNWHIWTVGSDGNNLTQWTTGLYDHREPDFAPDGLQMAYATDRSGTYDIWTINKSTGKQEPITSGDYNDYGPAYSPDASQIAFIRKTPDNWELNTIDLSTKEIRTILQSEHKLYAPAWHHDQSALSYTEHNWLESQLKSVDISSGIVSLISRQDEDVFPFRAQHLTNTTYYTSDGLIKKHHGGKTLDVPFEISLPVDNRSYDRKKLRLVDTITRQIKGIYCPKISPDGSVISFIALADVWIKNLATNQLIRVTEDSHMQLMPTWHPDGSKLIYASDIGNTPALWEYDLPSSKSKKIGNIGAMPSGVSVSPKGTTIAYTMAFGPRSGRLSLMDYHMGTTSSPRQNFPYSTSAPTWHPDGRHILMSILQPYSNLYREGISRNIIVDIETGATSIQSAPAHISFGARTNDAPIIADDGNTLLYISKGQLYEIAMDANMNLKGEAQQLYTDMADDPSISADQNLMLLMSGAQLKLLDRASATTEDITIDLEYRSHPDDQLLVIHAGTIITMDNQILHDHDIIIRNQMIEEITPHKDRPESTFLIDASDQYVLPGLIDMHAHQGSDLGTSLGYQWLSWGVTSTRDPATYPYDAQNRKEAQINGDILHPRIFYTGSPIDGNRVYYNGTYAQFSVDQVKRELQRSVALDYDLIKTYVRLPDSLQKEVIDLAHNAGLPVTSHELYPAALMGIDGVEHILGTSRRGYTTKMSETYHSYSDVPAIMAAANMTFTPTIGIYSSYKYMLFQHPELLKDPRFTTLESDYVKASATRAITLVEEQQEKYGEMYHRQATLIYDAHHEGVKIIAGTDSPIIPYGFSLFVELLSYQQAGLNPEEVIKTATVNAARALNVDGQIGKIKEGMIADMLILDEDPLQDIMNLKTLNQVVLSGEVLKIDDLLREYSSFED